MACVPSDAVTLSFANLAYSNLGGQGGVCDTPGRCESLHHASTPRGIYYSNVGTTLSGVSFDLRIE